MSDDATHQTRRRGRSTQQIHARDLATEAELQALGRQTFVKHVFTRLPLVSAFVITINLFVQVRGDVGLAVAIAQNLTFGAIAVIVLLNLVTYIMIGVMVALMPMIVDRHYNRWGRIVGALVEVLFSVVLAFTATWLVLATLVVVFVVVAVIVRLRRKPPTAPLTSETVTDLLRSSPPPTDTELRRLWADGRAMLRAVSADAPPLTPVEKALLPAPEPQTFSAVAGEWNARAARIRGPRSKSLTGLAFAGIVGFVALFGLVILTQPIRFAPLEQVSIKGEAPLTGFLLLTTGRGLFVPEGQGPAQFITAADITSVELCADAPHWYSLSVVDYLAPTGLDGVECTAP